MTVQPSAISPSRGKPKPARTAGARVRYLEQIALSLALDRTLLEAQREGQIGFVLPVGDWAGVLAAAAAAPRSSELIFPSLRESRVALFRGLPLVEVFRQSLGLDAPGVDPLHSSAGHALPGTLADAARRVAAPGGTPGAHLPHAVGAALAARLTRRAEAVLALAGVAATDGDDCHVALNFAAVSRAPVVFLFRGDPAWPRGHVVQRMAAYAVPATLVEGDDLAQLDEQLSKLLATAREGGGPAVLEVASPKPLSVEVSVLAAALERCAAALKEAGAGLHPPVGSIAEGVFAEPTRSLTEQAHELAGEVVVPPEEI